MLPGLKPDGREFILTNIEILNLTADPEDRSLIIGAGAVGVEFASMFNRFGTKVTILEMLPRIVPVEDEESFEGARARVARRRFASRPAPKCENVQKTGTGVQDEGHALQRQEGRASAAEKLLVAVGRAPNTANIGAREHQGRTGPRLHQSESSGSRPPNRAFMRSATWWRARRNWRTWRPCRAWWRWRTWRASR